MLKFLASGPNGWTLGGLTSQQWQLVDLAAYATEIDAGRVRLDARVSFNRVAGDRTDRRFDLRILAMQDVPARFPAKYPPPADQIRAGTVQAMPNGWQEVAVAFDPLPQGARSVAVEIYPWEDVQDDAASEFAGHYADDASLILTLKP